MSIEPLSEKDVKQRKHLLARMAGNIAAGLMPASGPRGLCDSDFERIPEVSVRLARRILVEVGL